ncbi:hypothetical protein FUA23_18480 [Neolewinella aurantiaca]|uniref:Uncharacterized protein n=1 Tax=Neolewinella aurantiaca TaxID=2602767 RepID=A0A5C7FBR2_9BACT|nr:hypothetical protein [Neolewinella aurantiaca]TXF87573.1 hypothetical protein FUA23_18480 [Neolewinella aurantiaca]
MYTEQNIRGLAINFLRQHYKLRPRSGTSGTRVVHRPHYYEGVTIDARLAYQKPDLSWFTATVEASSVDSAHEVLYRVNYFRIGAHSLLFTLVVMTGYLAVTQVQGESLWAQFGRPGVYSYLLTLFLTIWGVSGVLLSRLKYYRYIYAIAQFIRFHADAQWVAYDRKIFEGLKSKYYVELQRQCLRFGFGLMEIQEDNKVRWIIEPSHIDQFKGSRAKLPLWVAVAGKTPPLLAGLRKKLPLRPGTKTNVPEPAQPAPPEEMTDPLSVGAYLPMYERKDDYLTTIIPAKKGRVAWYKQPARVSKRLRWKIRHAIRSLYPPEIRKRPGYYELPWGVTTAFIVTFIAFGTLIYLQSEWTAERRPGQVAAAPDLEPLETAATPADSDASPEVLPGEYDHELSAKSPSVVRDTILDLNEDAIIVPASLPQNTIFYLRYDTSGVMESSYGCGPLVRSNVRGYILQEGRYPEYEVALERATYLNGAFSIPVAILLADCLEEGAPGYILYVGDLLSTEPKANFDLRRYSNAFELELSVVEIK